MDLVIKKDNDNQSPFFGDLVSIMKNKEFRELYETYFTDWNEIQSMVFFMKLYSTIEYEYQERFKSTISEKDMKHMLHNVMDNNVTRRYAVELFQEFKISNDYQKTKQFRSLLAFKEPLAIGDAFL
jgi:hypothetical protein|tara:strand:+ start:723 stop:1100 length:378 start_codon:yes stop_codon:yes gene_type:complete